MFYSPERLQINPLWFEEIPHPCELRLLDIITITTKTKYANLPKLNRCLSGEVKP